MSVLWLLAACAVPWTEVPTEGVYPHPEGFVARDAHGMLAIADPETCASCHDAAAPSCATCHPAYPHEPVGDRVHPPAEAGCGICHDDPDAWASRDASCTRCHPSYPHATDWGGQHGTYALARGNAAAVCGNCHGASLEGGEGVPGCGDCHVAWPHPSSWASQHVGVDPATCTLCHGPHGEGGSAGVPCSQCHVAQPHPEGWAPAGHIPVAARVGEDTCLRCHEAGQGPSGVHATCASRCHGEAP